MKNFSFKTGATSGRKLLEEADKLGLKDVCLFISTEFGEGGSANAKMALVIIGDKYTICSNFIAFYQWNGKYVIRQCLC